MHFYLSNPQSGIIIDPESRHLLSMRIQPGQTVRATDLRGGVYELTILEIEKKTKTIRFHSKKLPIYSPKKTPKTLIQAIPDKHYLDKLCEIIPLAGVQTLYLYFSNYSLKYQINKDRLEKILIRALELGEISDAVELTMLDSLEQFQKILLEFQPAVLDCSFSPLKLSQVVEPKSTQKNNHIEQSLSVVVGPEGGWSPDEIQLFEQLQLPKYSMGTTIYPSWLAGYTYFCQRSDNDPL